MSSVLASASLWQRELVRFFRQPSRLAGAFLPPLLFWLVIGSGLSGSFRVGASRGAAAGGGGLDFLEYFFPGTVILLVLFAAIFSTISLIEDRSAGFLQGVLVAPVGAGALVAGKVLGGATLAWLQGIVFLLLAPAAGVPLAPAGALAAAGVLGLVAIALTSFGFAFAWKVDSTQGFHAVMNLLLAPMWLLSGAFFPLSGAPAWLAGLMRANPLTYGVAALRRALYLGAGAEAGVGAAAEAAPLGLSLTVLLVWCGGALVVDWILVARRARRR